MHPSPDYVLIGHFTRDLTSHGERAGGAVLYAGVTAARLGRRVGIVTACDPTFEPPEALAGAQILRVPAETTTTFVHGQDPTGRRTLSLYRRAPTIAAAAVPTAWRTASILHLAPVAHEIDAREMAATVSPGLLVATVQGWLRTVRATGAILPDAAALTGLPLAALGAAALSVEDVGGDVAAVARAAVAAPLLAMTVGAHGCRIYLHGVPTDVPAWPAQEIDSVGAGDVFAAALFVRLAETGDALESARFAACAAACAVEGQGWDTIPTRAQVLARLHAA